MKIRFIEDKRVNRCLESKIWVALTKDNNIVFIATHSAPISDSKSNPPVLKEYTDNKVHYQCSVLVGTAAPVDNKRQYVTTVNVDDFMLCYTKKLESIRVLELGWRISGKWSTIDAEMLSCLYLETLRLQIQSVGDIVFNSRYTEQAECVEALTQLMRRYALMSRLSSRDVCHKMMK